MNEGDDADHVDVARGQTVNCHRAAFIVAGGVPVSHKDRFELGFMLGAGATAGVAFMVGLIGLARLLVKAILA